MNRELPSTRQSKFHERNGLDISLLLADLEITLNIQ